MKRIITISLVIALALTLMLPAAALAKRGGVPAGGSDKSPAATRPENAKSGHVASDRAIEDTKAAKPAPPGQAKRDAAVSDEETAAAPLPGRNRDRVRTEESSASPEPKRTGTENALFRLQRNLERMQADLDAGTRSSLPQGLQSVIAKFMAWLGIDADAPDGGVEDGDGSVEPTGTIEPTSTIEPTETIEATTTI